MTQIKKLKIGKFYTVQYKDYASFTVVSRSETHTKVLARKLYQVEVNEIELKNNTVVHLLKIK